MKKIILLLLVLVTLLFAANVSAAACTGTETDGVCYDIQNEGECLDSYDNYYGDYRQCYWVSHFGICDYDEYCDASSPGLTCGTDVYSDLTLTENLTGCTDYGLYVDGTDITIDCDGFSIEGDNTGDTIGIEISGTSSGITIKNCVIKDFESGIKTELDAGPFHNLNINIINNQIISNDGSGGGGSTGIHLENADYVNISHNDISNNAHSGIFLIGNHSFIWNNTVNNNTDTGISITTESVLLSFDQITNHTLLENTVNYNTGDGIFIRGASKVTMYDNIVTYNTDDGVYLVDITDSNATFSGNIVNSNEGDGFEVRTINGPTEFIAFEDTTVDCNSGDGIKIDTLVDNTDWTDTTSCYNNLDINNDDTSTSFLGTTTCDTDDPNTICTNPCCGNGIIEPCFETAENCPADFGGGAGEPIPEFKGIGLIITLTLIGIVGVSLVYKNRKKLTETIKVK